MGNPVPREVDDPPCEERCADEEPAKKASSSFVDLMELLDDDCFLHLGGLLDEGLPPPSSKKKKHG